jgi:hypothetical protein
MGAIVIHVISWESFYYGEKSAEIFPRNPTSPWAVAGERMDYDIPSRPCQPARLGLSLPPSRQCLQSKFRKK